MKHEGVPTEIDVIGNYLAHQPAATDTYFEDDKPQDECGVFAIYAPGEAVGAITIDAMRRLQHRGQSGAGVAYKMGETVMGHARSGLVEDVIKHDIHPPLNPVNMIDSVESELAIGHVRYSTADSNDASQPFIKDLRYAQGHNGHVEEVDDVADRMAISIEGSKSDSDSIAKLIWGRAKELTGDVRGAIHDVAPQLEGAYCLVITDGETVYGVRDPWGTHPLSIATLRGQNRYALASEAVAFNSADVVSVRDVEPGEVVSFGPEGLKSSYLDRQETPAHCMFEYIYIARPESVINGVNVYAARKKMGEFLAEDRPAEADVVVGVPNSGLSAAAGYARASKIPQVLGLFKDEYVGRSFIEREGKRDEILRRKLTPNVEEVKDRRVILVDDSLIKGNTMRALVGILREAGASEVHVRLAAPRYMYPCYGGMDTRQTHRLIARGNSDERIAQEIGADSVGFNSVERVAEAVEAAADDTARAKRVGSAMCTACATGRYPYKVPGQGAQETAEIDLVELALAGA